MASIHEEEVLGKAYDSRLMKRLLKYLRPYTWQVAIALAAIVLKAGADVLGPYLTKIAIDKYLASRRHSFRARPLAEFHAPGRNRAHLGHLRSPARRQPL